MGSWLRDNRARIEKDLSQARERQYFSPAFLVQHQRVSRLIDQHVSGRAIDLGCGTMPFRESMERRAVIYHSIDMRPRSEGASCVGDIRHLPMVSDSSYDSAICLEVLEHIPNPFQAIDEIYRVLKPSGTLIVSVPHLSRLHDEPHDYFRFTDHGLRHLLEYAGFEVLDLQEKGGLFSFLGHQVSTLLLSLVWTVTGLRRPAWFLNKWLVTKTCYELDRRFRLSGIFALGYVGVALKPSPRKA